MEQLGLWFLREAGCLGLTIPKQHGGTVQGSSFGRPCIACTYMPLRSPSLLVLSYLTIPHTLLSAQGIGVAKSSSGWMKQAVLSALGMCVTCQTAVGSSAPIGRSCVGIRSLARHLLTVTLVVKLSRLGYIQELPTSICMRRQLRTCSFSLFRPRSIRSLYCR